MSPRHAGRELDAQVAERVMGWRWFVRAGDSPSTLPDSRELLKEGEWPHTPRLYAPAAGHERIGASDFVPAYSTDLAAAWQVITARPVGVWTWGLRQQDNGDWAVEIRHGYCTSFRDSTHTRSDSLPHAICLAALAAAAASEVNQLPHGVPV